jgi:hypothetical protein
LLSSQFAGSALFAATAIGVDFQGRDGVTTPDPATPPSAQSDVAGVVPQPGRGVMFLKFVTKTFDTPNRPCEKNLSSRTFKPIRFDEFCFAI